MARRALLIGAQTGGLRGVGNDLTFMREALDRWGFRCDLREAENACRAGILDAYERLIAEARPDDTVVVYYSGHGGYSRPPDGGDRRRRGPALQFIVPTDFDESTEEDFRGILSVELSILLARLTEKTKNVTVALDCCHAAHMCREDGRGLVAKALLRPLSYEVLARHADALRRRRDVDLWRPPGNPWAVRIVACAPDESAYEYTNPDGVRVGILTDALTRALNDAHAGGLRLSWSRVVERVRQQVLDHLPAQRPEVEGPAQRILFETAEADTVTALPVLAQGDRVTIEGAALLGVRVGDEFVVVPPDSTGAQDQATLGHVVIDEVSATTASGPLRRTVAGAPVPMGARAYQVRAAAEAMPVRLPAGGGAPAALVAAVRRSPVLRVAEPGEPCPAEVRVNDDGELVIWDRVGPLHRPRRPDAEGVESLVRNLTILARAEALRRLADDPTYALDIPVEVEFGLVVGGEKEPLATSGAVLYLGQRIYLRVRNNGDRRCYVSLLDIGVSGRVGILTDSSPSGEPLDPGGEYTFGFNDLKNVLQGQQLVWPAELERAVPRPETVIVLVTSQPQHIRGLEQHGVRSAAAPRPGGSALASPLERWFDQIASGGTRDIAPVGGRSVRYTVRAVHFELVPTPPPVVEEPEYQVDERPEASALLWSPRSVGPTTVAVRLSDLVVHRNRALRGATIRLDTMVLTRGTDGRPVYQARTERFCNVRDGETLPLDKMLIYHGPAVDYLDIAVWVSRDASGSLALADLMQEKVTDPDVQMAMGQVGALLTSAPQAAMAVAAIGAGAVLINAAYHLLTGIVGHSIGLYRTTLLAGERFGVGRPGERRAVRAQDFSFTFAVEEVPGNTSSVSTG